MSNQPDSLRGDTLHPLDIGTFVRNSVEAKSIRIRLKNNAKSPVNLLLQLSTQLKYFFSSQCHCVPETHRTSTQTTRTKLSYNNNLLEISYSLVEDDNVNSNINLIEKQNSDIHNVNLLPDQEQILDLILSQSILNKSHLISSTEETKHSSKDQKISGYCLLTEANSTSIFHQIPLHGQISSSLLRSDVDFIDFGWCPLVRWSHKPLTIHNLSSVPTSFTISSAIRASTRNADHVQLAFYNLRTGREIDTSSVPIEPHQSIRLRIGIHGYSSGQYQTSFSIQNRRQPQNYWYVLLTARIGCEKFAEGLEVSCLDTLDFGECYANCITARDISLQNNHKQTLRFTAISDRSDQISFELVQEWTSNKLRKRDSGRSDQDSSSTEPFKYQHDIKSQMQSTERDKSGTGNPEVEHLKKETGGKGAESDQMSKNEDDPNNSLYMSMDDENNENGVHVSSRKGPKRNSRIDNITLVAGQRITIRIWYYPKMPYNDMESEMQLVESDQGKFVSERFNLFFRLPSGDNRVIIGRASVCESSIRLATTETNLGECNLLSEYKTVLSIINCSDLSTTATISYASTSVRIASRRVYMKPREAIDVPLSFTPRQINPSYYKEITITNLGNPDAPSMVFTLRANCVDHQGISLHALFYKVLAPRPTNEIYFGGTVVNHPAIRAFSIMNISKKKLVLKFDSCERTRLFMPTKVSALQIPWNDASKKEQNLNWYREAILHNHDDYHNFARKSWTTEAIPTKSQLDISEKIKGLSISGLPEELEKGLLDKGMFVNKVDEVSGCCTTEKQERWKSFLECLGHRNSGILDSTPTIFSSDDAELKYTERQFRSIRKLNDAMKDGYLEEGDRLELLPLEESFVVVSIVLHGKDVRNRTKFRDFERRLSVVLEEFDEERLKEMSTEGNERGYSMRRDIILTGRSCKSAMNIAPLSQLNFGNVRYGEQKDKTFTIINLSEAPLLYEICKGNGESFEDLRFNLGKGSKGMIRPYSNKLVRFIYTPSKLGEFREEIVVRNQLDEWASCRLVVKANVSMKTEDQEAE